LGAGIVFGRNQEPSHYAVDDKGAVSATATPERLEIETYVTNKVIFTLEQGHLVYMETMGVVR